MFARQRGAGSPPLKPSPQVFAPRPPDPPPLTSFPFLAPGSRALRRRSVELFAASGFFHRGHMRLFRQAMHVRRAAMRLHRKQGLEEQTHGVEGQKHGVEDQKHGLVFRAAMLLRRQAMLLVREQGVLVCAQGVIGTWDGVAEWEMAIPGARAAWRRRGVARCGAREDFLVFLDGGNLRVVPRGPM